MQLAYCHSKHGLVACQHQLERLLTVFDMCIKFRLAMEGLLRIFDG